MNRSAQRHNKNKIGKHINDPQKKYPYGRVRINILLEGFNPFHDAKLTLSSDVSQDTKMFELHEIALTYPCIISWNI